MKIAYLTNQNADFKYLIPNFISSHKIECEIITEKVSLETLVNLKIDYIISDRFKFLLTPEICRYYDGRALNLHGSICPNCRGYYPILWTVIEKKPMGGTIFYIDEGIDTGDILQQFEIEYTDNDTLRSCWIRVQMGMYEGLFKYWNDFLNLKAPRKRQVGFGTLHYKKEFENVKDLLTNGWDTKIKDIYKLLNK
ncbi:MAG: formyltransferase family protein [Chthoniobacterales bacterium]|nr:formyltransferase family protein [Chthoniobacterales bacterium]